MEETPRPPVGYPSHESRGGARAHCDDDAHNSPPRHTPGVTPGESNIPQFVPRGPRYPSRRQSGARRAPNPLHERSSEIWVHTFTPSIEGIRLGLTERPPRSLPPGGFNIMRNRSFDTLHIDSEERDR